MLTIAITAGLIRQNGKISGLTYFNYQYSDDKDTFGINRVYLIYQNQVSGRMSYKFQLDMDPGSHPKNLYLKNAKID